MKVVEGKSKSLAVGKNLPFFLKGSEQNFFGKVSKKDPFFAGQQKLPIQTKRTIGQPLSTYEKETDAMADKGVQRLSVPDVLAERDTTIQAATPLASEVTHFVQTKCADCEQEENLVQRQERPDETEAKDVSPDTKQPVAPEPARKTPRTTKCNMNPEFPDFGCFAGQLKLDIDDNLRNNAYQFYRVASLYPGDNELMWNTFMRYGLGVNLLETSFGFLGVNKKWGSILSYGTGVGLKSYQFLQKGELKLDIPIPLGKGVNLDIKFDLNVDPDNIRDIKGVDTTIGITRRF
jgi:hypothetical protein